MLVLVWTHFCLQNCLNSSWHRFNKVLKHSSEILVHIDMISSHSCCRFVGCTSMMRISRSTTSQRCSIGLRSGDCGGHLSKVNSMSCSRNQSEMIWALWHGALSCWKYSSEDGYTVVIKGWTWSTTILRQAVAFKRCSIGTKRPKVCQENIPYTITPPPPAWTIETRQDGSMLSCSLHQIMTLSSECSRNQDSSDQGTFFQSSIVQFWWSCVNCSLCFLFLADRSSREREQLKLLNYN